MEPTNAVEKQTIPLGNVYTAVLEGLFDGASEDQIKKYMEGQSVSTADASRLLEKAKGEVAKTMEKTNPTLAALLTSAAFGLFWAVVSGIVWMFVVKYTDYEVGFLALGIGYGAAFGMTRLNGGYFGQKIQIVSVIFSLIGVAFAKMFTIAYFIKLFLAEEGMTLSYIDIFLSPEFYADLPMMLAEAGSVYDLLWIGLAVMAAWKLADATVLYKKTVEESFFVDSSK